LDSVLPPGCCISSTTAAGLPPIEFLSIAGHVPLVFEASASVLATRNHTRQTAPRKPSGGIVKKGKVFSHTPMLDVHPCRAIQGAHGETYCRNRQTGPEQSSPITQTQPRIKGLQLANKLGPNNSATLPHPKHMPS